MMRFWRFFYLPRPRALAGWYSQEVPRTGYSWSRPVGPFPSYLAAFNAAGSDTLTPADAYPAQSLAG